MLLLALSATVAAPPEPAAASVAGCSSFTVSRGSGSSLTASSVRRSSRLSCRMARNLLKAAYRLGPLKIVRVQYVGGSGRPILWIRGGWRCSNGAGGAACRNAKRKRYNEVSYGDDTPTQAVTANVR